MLRYQGPKGVKKLSTYLKQIPIMRWGVIWNSILHTFQILGCIIFEILTYDENLKIVKPIYLKFLLFELHKLRIFTLYIGTYYLNNTNPSEKNDAMRVPYCKKFKFISRHLSSGRTTSFKFESKILLAGKKIITF